MIAPAIRGVVAQVKYTYFTAAALEGYTVVHAGDDWTATGRVLLSDPYLLSLRPLMFVAPHKGGAFRWPIGSLTLTDDRLVARLGPPLP